MKNKKSFKQRALAKHAPKKTGPKEIPESLQLPGGITVQAQRMRVTKVSAAGRPLAFELAAPGEESDCRLWVADIFLQQRLPDEMLVRMRQRLVDTGQVPAQVYKTRSLGPSVVTIPEKDDRVLMNPTNYRAMEDMIGRSKLRSVVEIDQEDPVDRELVDPPFEQVITLEEDTHVVSNGFRLFLDGTVSSDDLCTPPPLAKVNTIVLAADAVVHRNGHKLWVTGAGISKPYSIGYHVKGEEKS